MTIGMWILRLPYAAMIGCSGRCNRVATRHRSLYRCRSRCVYASYGFPGKSTGISYLFNNCPADRRQFYLPRVVGHSIGLPGIWVLAAVIVGGGAFGIWGILFAVPLAAAIYRLLRPSTLKPCSKLHGFLKISRNQIELTLSVFFKLNGTSSCVAGLLRSIMPNNRSILFLAIFSYP